VKLSQNQKRILKEYQESAGVSNYPGRQEFQRKVEKFFERKQALGK